MNTSIDPSTDRFLASLSLIQQRAERAQRQLSSGKRVNSPSDGADEISVILQSRLEVSRITQLKTNLGRVKTEVDTAEQVVGLALTVLDRAKILGSEGSSGTITPEARRGIAGEVKSLLDQLAGIARTQVDGRYIFSGDNDQVPPYAVDLTQPKGVSAYAGSPATRQTEHPSGTLFPISKTAQQIFDDPNPAKNVFGTINALRVALANNDTNALSIAQANLNTAFDKLNSSQSFYGAVQNQVTEATDYASRQEVRFRTQLSQVEDADIASAISEFQQAQLQQQTALTSRAQKLRTTLFDYLFK